MRIAFLDINSSYSHSSLALPVLHQACDNAGVRADWHHLRGTINDDIGFLSSAVAAQKPDVICSTLYLFNRDHALKVLRRAARLCPDASIYLGGPEFLGNNEQFLEQESYVNCVVRGEGEKAIVSLLQGEKHETIDGLCWLADGYQDNGKATLTEAEFQELSFIRNPFYDWSKPFAYLETSRGCPHTCSFCTSCGTGKPRWQSINQVTQDLELAHAKGVREIRLLDRTFNASPRLALERLQLFKAEFADLRFHLEIHPAFLTDELVDEFASAPEGMFHLELGVQTSNPDVLKACGRTGDAERVWSAIQALQACPGVELHVDLLAGLPGLMFDYLLQDLAELTRRQVSEIQLETLKVLKGTPLADKAGTMELTFAPDPPYEILQTATMSSSEIDRVRELSLIVDRYYNHSMTQQTVISALASNPGFYMDFRVFLESRSALLPPASLENRGKWLHQFLRNDAASQERLELDWLRAGLSPGKGLGLAAHWKGPVPESARLMEGDLRFRPEQSKIWHMKHCQNEYWIIYDRGLDRAHPIAIFCVSTQ